MDHYNAHKKPFFISYLRIHLALSATERRVRTLHEENRLQGLVRGEIQRLFTYGNPVSRSSSHMNIIL